MKTRLLVPRVAALAACVPLLTSVAAPATKTGPATPSYAAKDLDLTQNTPPKDIPDQTSDGLNGFAWQEFIALMWPAQANPPPTVPPGAAGTPLPPTLTYQRCTPTAALPASGGSHAGDVTVWETYYHRVELFSGPANPATPTSGPDKGIPVVTNVVLPDPNANPVYNYSGASSITPPTVNPATNQALFNNLDEASEIQIAKMYYTPLATLADSLLGSLATAQAAAAQPGGVPVPAALVSSTAKAQVQAGLLYEAKGNNVFFNYLATNGFNNIAPRTKAQNNTIKLITNQVTPVPPLPVDNTKYFLFPDNTIEIKATWRHYDATVDSLDDYHWTDGIYYTTDASGNTVSNIGRLLLVSLHIIQKTPSVPTFVFATFEHATNEVNGFRFTNLKAGATAVNGIPGETLPRPLPDGGVIQAVRQFPLTAATNAYNATIQSRLKAAGGIQAVWSNYRLIGVQHTPADNPESLKPSVPPSTTAATGTTPAPVYLPDQEFFLSNFATETNNTLQFFQGGLGGTNFDLPVVTKQGVAARTASGHYRAYASGGCLGCHGAAGQVFGGDFSVIATTTPFAPEAVTPYPGGTVTPQNNAGFPLTATPPAPPPTKKKKKGV